MHPAILAAHAIAALQEGLITREQALAVGVTPAQLRTQVNGHWPRVLPGIYQCGPPVLSQRGLALAGLFEGGSGASLSGQSSLELRGCLPVRGGEVGITTGRDKERKVMLTEIPVEGTGEPGCIAFRTVHRDHLPQRLDRVEGLVSTHVPRSLVDLANEADDATLLRVWKEAEFKAILDPDAIRAELANHRRPGSAAVRRLLDERAPVTKPGDDLRSRRERRFLEIVRDAGLPRPLINELWDFGPTRCRPDFHWVDLMLVAAIDGEQHNVLARDRVDKVQAADLASVGVLVVPFPDHRLFGERPWCVRRIHQIVEQRRLYLGRS